MNNNPFPFFEHFRDSCLARTGIGFLEQEPDETLPFFPQTDFSATFTAIPSFGKRTVAKRFIQELSEAAVGYSVITVPISRPPWLTATTYPLIFGSKTTTSLKRWDTPCAIAQATGSDAGPFRKTVWPPWSLSSSRAETASRTI